MKHVIFTVEDDENIRYIIEKTLINAGYDVVGMSSSKQLFEALQTKIPSVILLDIMLPGATGLEILKQLKKHPKYQTISVIIISAKTDEIDKVQGLDLGADDYLAKPFGVLELTSRVNAQIRRLSKAATILRSHDIVLNVEEHTCMKKDVVIPLTHKEFDLLNYFLENKNRAISREELLNKVWGYDYAGETRTLDMHIRMLRQKLSLDQKESLIQSIRSIGYKWME